MMNHTPKIYQFSLRTIQIITLILSILFCASGIFATCFAEDMVTQQALTRFDNPLLCIPATLLAMAVILLFFRTIGQNPKAAKPILLITTLGWIALLGAVLILFGKTVPAADAYSVYSAAEALAKGDTSVIHPTESYLSYYPQQVGLMAFLEILHRMWNLFPLSLPAYHFIKGIYVLLLCVAVLFQCKTVHTLWENDTADCIYLILAGANLPMIMYSSFVYGEIPSFTAFSVGLFLLLEFLKTLPPGKLSKTAILQGFFSVLFFCLGVMLRKNTLILIIAAAIVLFLEALKLRKGFPLLLGVASLIGALSILPLTEQYYEQRTGQSLSSGVPAMSYFAMGMQEASRGCGWYNGFNFNTYQETGMDNELTGELSRQAIAERLATFQENPSYALSFYGNKYLTQWVDGTYASRQATLATFGGRSSFFDEVYEGKYSRLYIEYCNLYQNVLYLGVLLFALYSTIRSSNKKGTSSPSLALLHYTGIIGVLGGFLFHFIWEANSRYIFIYSLLLLPYAAYGIAHLVVHVSLGNSRKII